MKEASKGASFPSAYNGYMSESAKDAKDRGQTEAESAEARRDLFADLKQAAQKGRQDRGSTSSR